MVERDWQVQRGIRKAFWAGCRGMVTEGFTEVGSWVVWEGLWSEGSEYAKAKRRETW